jgi:acyl dehydratase
VNLSAVLAHRFAPQLQRYDWRDAALYALALGIGSDPLDADELPYVYETYQRDAVDPQLRAVPSYCMTLGWLPFWQDDPALAIAWQRIVHGEMSFTLHRPLPPAGQVRATHRIAAVLDKGAGRGALMHVDKELHDAGSGVSGARGSDTTGAPLASLRSVEFLRDDGGCGSFEAAGERREALAPLPADFRADVHQDYATLRQGALLYRLASRDLMPIHADPAVARRAGFDRPISHGLNNMGLACRAILKHFAPCAPEAVRAMGVRFVQPGLPGDTVRIEMQRSHGTVRFRARALERDVPLLDRGFCRLEG